MSKENNQVLALKQASKAKRNNTLLKVETTLQLMKDNNLSINFESLAKLAGVSKTWIYQQDDLRNEIYKLRNKKGKIERVIDLRSTLSRKDELIKKLKYQNNQLKITMKKLRTQLETVYGELYKIKSTK